MRTHAIKTTQHVIPSGLIFYEAEVLCFISFQFKKFFQITLPLNKDENQQEKTEL